MPHRNMRRVLRKFRKSALTKFEFILGYTPPRQISRQNPIGSTISHQWYPVSSEPSAARLKLSVRNPDLDHTSGIPTKPVYKAYTSDPCAFPVSSEPSAARSKLSVRNPDLDHTPDFPTKPVYKAYASDSCASRSILQPPVGQPQPRILVHELGPSLPTKTVYKAYAPDSYNSGKETFEQSRSILQSSVGQPQPQILVHELGSSQPKTFVPELGPSQPKTLVRKQACRNLAASVPIITLTPPDTSTDQALRSHDVRPTLRLRNADGLRITDPFPVVENSVRVTSQPPVLNFASLSSTPVCGPSAPAPTSTGHSSAFLTVPSFHSSKFPSQQRSTPISVKYRPAEASPEARWAIKIAEIESFSKKLEDTKRELREIEAKVREK
ncbi:hypothetical protein MMC07_004794 [Pseudocyphellaria aurata]|nr:hypothetical protein [Pseudocyphellaria aurata]